MKNKNRNNPYPPNFNNRLANNIEPTVGASTCASVNHKCNGNIGNFIPKGINKHKNIIPLAPAISSLFIYNMISNFVVPVIKYIHIRAASKKKDPINV